MQWVAYYTDNTWLRQYDDYGAEHKYTDIDRRRLASFALYDGGVDPNDKMKAVPPGISVGAPYIPATRKVLHLHLEPGQRLIYRRRVEMKVGAPAPVVVYMVGWQQTIDSENVQSIAYAFEDGTIELAGRWRDDHPWFYSVQHVPSEE